MPLLARRAAHPLTDLAVLHPPLDTLAPVRICAREHRVGEDLVDRLIGRVAHRT